ncbi:hypothetical protein [Streptomyces sp. NPDC018031]|uniref:hypothetical protein n=1 Tax=Streptomyces sp. NPDC018031 TaxID=3365033 RepID=UPI0037BB9A6A
MLFRISAAAWDTCSTMRGPPRRRRPRTPRPPTTLPAATGGRYVTVAYTATLPSPLPLAGDDATAARWCPLDALPDLAFDHAEVLADAAAR